MAIIRDSASPNNSLKVNADGSINTTVQFPATGLEINNDNGNPIPVSVASLPLPAGAAADSSIQAVTTSLGTDGTSPPAISGTGVRGWLRAIYDVLNIRGSGVGTNAQRVQLADESLAALETISIQSSALPTGAATETSLAGVRTDLGTDGATPPSIPGTGVRGWLRSIYDTLKATLTVQGTVTANLGTIGAAATAANQTNVQSAAGSANATVVNVQGNAGGVPLPVSGTVALSGTSAVSGTVTANQGAAGASAWPVSVGNTVTVQGTVTANAGTGNFTVVQPTASNLQATVTPAAGSQGTAAASPFFEQIVQGGAALSSTNPLPVGLPASQFAVVQSAANAAGTLTLPAPPAGQFHYITSLTIKRANTTATAVAAAAANLAYTSTNLNGFSVHTGNIAAAGTTYTDYDRDFATPVRSQVAATATTIVAPAGGAGVQTEIIATYYTAP